MKPLLARIEKLIEIGIALSAEQDNARLLEMILIGAKEITGADGGTLYTVHDDNTLTIDIIRTDSLNFAMGGTTGKAIPFPPIPLYDEDGSPKLNMVVTSAVLECETINIPDAYNADGYDFSGTRAFDQKTGYRSTSFLTIPMKDHEGDIIGVLQLLNATDDDSGTVIPFSYESQRLAESLASQAAIALTKKRLLDELKILLESLIQLIATAIDEKSPYTGGHCRRVPEITLMLADAAAATTDGPLKEFRMSDEERYELSIAAWLHDCGKITTPEYVVDKATKLETIFDRLELVKTRYAVRRSEAQTRMLQRKVALLEAGEAVDDVLLQQQLDQEIKDMEAELAFLETANLGGEFMDEADQARVVRIASNLWHDETGVEQPLLSDNEVYNLNIAKGTLTPEERQVINHHIEATISMLEKLPFPKHLRNVPEFAGGHHERMDGHGYPRGLTGPQMSVQARVMAIADIFEALTAQDRPYKPGKKLSESLRILGFMKQDGHIDPDLFDLFIRGGIWRQYAERYMDPSQVDEVDITRIPGFNNHDT